MRLKPGKLYKFKGRPYFHDREGTKTVVGSNKILLFLGKGEYVPRRTTRPYIAHTPYYFLRGEEKVTFRKYYNDRLDDFFERAGEEKPQ